MAAAPVPVAAPAERHSAAKQVRAHTDVSKTRPCLSARCGRDHSPSRTRTHALSQDALSRTKKPTAAAAGKGDAAEKFESDPIWNPNSGERAKQLKAIPLSSAERAALTAPVAAPPVVDAKALAKKEKRQQRAAAAAVEAATIQAAIDAANGDADHDWHVVAPKKTTKKVDTALPVEA